MQSFTWGVSHATHLFNAMNPYHHRKPGIVGAVFDAEVTCDVIADMVHTHASTLELVHKMKKDKLILITDAMRAGCMKCGTYDLGGRKVEVVNSKALLDDGTLAGSVLKMNEALHNMTSHTSMTLVEAVNSVTKVPAQKLDVKKGKIRVGFDADIVMFDEAFNVLLSVVGGEIKYQ
jgi:N-acetylglucosamine-6-phosphate deacetylase